MPKQGESKAINIAHPALPPGITGILLESIGALEPGSVKGSWAWPITAIQYIAPKNRSAERVTKGKGKPVERTAQYAAPGVRGACAALGRGRPSPKARLSPWRS